MGWVWVCCIEMVKFVGLRVTKRKRERNIIEEKRNNKKKYLNEMVKNIKCLVFGVWYLVYSKMSC